MNLRRPTIDENFGRGFVAVRSSRWCLVIENGVLVQITLATRK